MRKEVPLPGTGIRLLYSFGNSIIPEEIKFDFMSFCPPLAG